MGGAAVAACSSDSSNGNGGSGPTGTTTSMTGSSSTTSDSTSSTSNVPLTCGEAITNAMETDCELLNQTCGTGFWCDMKTVGASLVTVCKPDTGGLLDKGMDCTQLSECKAGLLCVDKKCSPFCCPSTDEPCGGGSCDIKLNSGAGWAMMCSYATTCTLFEGTCTEGEYCHLTDAAQGLAVCDSPTANVEDEGGPCEYRNDCKESALCNKNPPDMGICRHLCNTTTPNADPGKGGCVAERECKPMKADGIPNLGICLPKAE